MSFIEGIFEICDQYINDSWYVGEAIPEKKLRNVIKEFPIPPDEEVLAVVDCTMFGSCKIGLAICTGGMFVNNDWTIEERKGYLPWYDFIDAKIELDGKYNVKVTPAFRIGLSGSMLKRAELVTILQHIQSYVSKVYRKDKASEDITPEMDESMWMLEIENEKFGPYPTETVIDMISGGQVEQDKTMAWKGGMEQGKVLSSISEFADVPPFERMELNNASIQDLLLLPGVDLKTAQHFIEERSKRNGFSHFNEVRDSLHLQPHQFEQVRKLTTLKPLNKMPGRGRIIDF
ncbi:helix-hairpin-helix domain-containing protein [Bacillus sp. PS06]|uniref:helix-hairpin-helix domain-containing protein n=1 Tax=Bacillus sp. PS06 TaxID=2764176 RepID=UPI0017860585|nr:helix-hairpin-helix domain-containing protein [Bacillus sp. PS06]MBD8067467.1 helix-hairpin-helix domain-containing protein [Bacillus sp. PS06]